MESDRKPQRESVQTKGRSPEYSKILTELEHIIGATGEEQRTYIEKRLADLSESAAAGMISLVGRGIHKGFLGPKMEIRRSMLVDPIVLDDPQLYMDMFETVRTFKEAEGWKGKSLREIMPNAIQWTLSKYFGNIVAGNNAEMKNEEFYLDHTTAESSAISIRDFKGKGFAVCAEKGPTAQNLLSFVGIESDLIVSRGCRIPAEANNEDGHFFILVHGTKGDQIYDPTNPRMVFGKDGNLTSYGPALYPVTEDQARRLVSGESIVVEHVDYTVDKDGQEVLDKSNRLYVGPEQRRINSKPKKV